MSATPRYFVHIAVGVLIGHWQASDNKPHQKQKQTACANKIVTYTRTGTEDLAR